MQVLSIPKKKRIYATAFSPTGRELAAACGDGLLRVWDLDTGHVRQSVPIEETSCGYDLAYLGDDRLAFAGVQLRWWDIPANGWNVIVPHMRWARQICVSPDGRLLAEADAMTSTEWGGSGLLVHDTATWRPVAALADATHTTGGLAFSTDSRWLAAGHIVRVGDKTRTFAYVGRFNVPDYDYIIRIRDVASGEVVRTVDGWPQGVRNIAFSPDGSVLAGTAGGLLRVWDLDGDRELAAHKRGTKHFQGLSFTADGRYLATVSNDETVRVWDARTWQEHTTFTWKIGRLLNIAFAPDGLRAAAGSDSGRVVIWDVEG